MRQEGSESPVPMIIILFAILAGCTVAEIRELALVFVLLTYGAGLDDQAVTTVTGANSRQLVTAVSGTFPADEKVASPGD